MLLFFLSWNIVKLYKFIEQRFYILDTFYFQLPEITFQQKNIKFVWAGKHQHKRAEQMQKRKISQVRRLFSFPINEQHLESCFLQAHFSLANYTKHHSSSVNQFDPVWACDEHTHTGGARSSTACHSALDLMHPIFKK